MKVKFAFGKEFKEITDAEALEIINKKIYAALGIPIPNIRTHGILYVTS